MREIRVALVDDHPVVLAGIQALLQDAAEIRVVGQATTGMGALALIRDAAPDVAVVDISLPDMSGIELAGRLAEAAPTVRLLALTVHEDRAYVHPLMRAGARGYLLKRSAAEDLVRAIRAVADGGLYLDPAVAHKALSDTVPPREASGQEREALSIREAEVLQLIAQGFSNKEIAGKLDVSVKTVETYKTRACEKLCIRTRAEIVRFGAAKGWLSRFSSED